MKIVVLADEPIFERLRGFNPAAEWIKIESTSSFTLHPDADAVFDLTPNAYERTNFPAGMPVFINSVLLPTNTHKNVLRINGWNGFIENETWEVAGHLDEKALTVLNFLNKHVIEAQNQPGLISARVIAMIINEAFYALDEGVSTVSEIDTAMKLGTNYPFGPFEWGEKIGLQNIYALLNQLSLEDNRYQPAPSLVKHISLS